VGRFFAALSFAFTVAASGAAAAAEPMEDVDYVLIAPQPGAGGGRIEVIEFFYYGCDSCYRFEPVLAGWLKKLPPDVLFRRVPALRRMDWVPLTRSYFALEEAGALDRLHGEVYKAIHERGINLGDSSELPKWAEMNGLERASFEKFLNSESVSAKVQKARDTTVAYGIRATPSMVVDGRYLTSGGMLGSLDALLPVVDGLIDKARKERAAK
jgi:thiol:disulfide interchange protein DsbA